jgi:methionyl-tRNA formyltransferase
LPATPQQPGIILDAAQRLLVATAEAALEIIELQPAGRRSMPTPEFLRGHRVRTGERFGPA